MCQGISLNFLLDIPDVRVRSKPATFERYNSSVKLFLASLGEKAQKPISTITLGVMDMGSFKSINHGWAKDAKAYYTTPNFSKSGRVDCDYATMTILSDEYAVDGKRAYYHGMPIEGVDVHSFRVTGMIEARDRYKKYRGDQIDWLK
jgi:hypothetical protein